MADDLKTERDRLVKLMQQYYEAIDAIRKRIGEIDTKQKKK